MWGFSLGKSLWHLLGILSTTVTRSTNEICSMNMLLSIVKAIQLYYVRFVYLYVDSIAPLA